MVNQNRAVNLSLALVHASEPEGDDSTDIFAIKRDGVVLFEIELTSARDSNEAGAKLRTLTDVQSVELPQIRNDFHAIALFAEVLDDVLIERDLSFYAECFYDDEGNAIEIACTLTDQSLTYE
jgi:hypothetical protein